MSVRKRAGIFIWSGESESSLTWHRCTTEARSAAWRIGVPLFSVHAEASIDGISEACKPTSFRLSRRLRICSAQEVGRRSKRVGAEFMVCKLLQGCYRFISQRTGTAHQAKALKQWLMFPDKRGWQVTRSDKIASTLSSLIAAWKHLRLRRG